MEKVDIAQEQNGNGRYSAAAWKRKTKWSIIEKVDIVGRRGKIVIAQQRGKSSHSGVSLKR